ncbi:MAG: tRNA (adenosine(37)-N6)-threonylcarbamoyltransferase complex dimerization subunit type 1 TsaB [Solirubrobacterales bacterium]
MRIVAVDTTTGAGSVALLEDGEARAEVRVMAADRHSRWLVRAVELVVEGPGLAPLEVDAWAVATGPGAFTGLRVGLSTVQGLALASSRPCVGLSSLDVLASLARGAAPTLVALVDAFRDEVYWGVYDGEARPARPGGVGPIEAALEGLTGAVAFVGNGVERYRERIRSRVPNATFPAHEPWLALALARLAATKLAAGERMDPAALRPIYLRGADIRKATP